MAVFWHFHSTGASPETQPQTVQMNGSLAGPVTLPTLSPAFIEFIYKSVVPACFFALIKPSEGDITQLISESISCLKSVQRIRGNDEFCSFLQTRLFPEHFPAYAHVNEMVVHFTGNETKALRGQFKLFVQQYRKENDSTWSASWSTKLCPNFQLLN